MLLLRHGCLLMFNCTARSLYIHSLEQHHNHSIFCPKTRVVISTFATINVNFTHAITSWRCYDTYGQRDVTRTWYLSVLKNRFELSPVFQSLVLRSRRSTSGDCFFFLIAHRCLERWCRLLEALLVKIASSGCCHPSPRSPRVINRYDAHSSTCTFPYTAQPNVRNK